MTIHEITATEEVIAEMITGQTKFYQPDLSLTIHPGDLIVCREHKNRSKALILLVERTNTENEIEGTIYWNLMETTLLMSGENIEVKKGTENIK